MLSNRLLTSFYNIFWSLLVSASIYTISDKFVEPILIPKWYAVGVIFVGGSLFLFIFFKPFSKIDWRFLYNRICITTNILIFFEAVLFLFQIMNLSNHCYNTSIGSFDNTAGFASCIALSFPIGFVHYSTYTRYKKLLFICLKVTCFVAVLLSESRIGLLCILFIVILKIFHHRSQKFIFGCLFLLFVFPISASFYKSDSTLGRWFIIERSLDMVKQHPFEGWGTNGFMANYMEEQANFFSLHPDSQYKRLADNIHHPLNEFLLVAIDYGVLMVILFIFFIYFFARYYYKHPSAYADEGFYIMLCLILLSGFSYPFSYPFTLLIAILAIVLIGHSFIVKIRFKRNAVLLKVFISLSLLIFSVSLKNSIHNQFVWKVAMEEIEHGDKDIAKSIYSNLYFSMNNNSAFLYNYGCEMYFAGEYELAKKLLSENVDLIADYDQQLLFGNVYAALGEDENALQSFQKATNMCPSRIIPLYEMYLIYSHRNDTLQCSLIHELIANTNFKRINKDVLKMMHYINLDFKRFKETNNKFNI